MFMFNSKWQNVDFQESDWGLTAMHVALIGSRLPQNILYLRSMWVLQNYLWVNHQCHLLSFPSKLSTIRQKQVICHCETHATKLWHMYKRLSFVKWPILTQKWATPDNIILSYNLLVSDTMVASIFLIFCYGRW